MIDGTLLILGTFINKVETERNTKFVKLTGCRECKPLIDSRLCC